MAVIFLKEYAGLRLGNIRRPYKISQGINDSKFLLVKFEQSCILNIGYH